MLCKSLVTLGLAAVAMAQCSREQLLKVAKAYTAAQAAGKLDELKPYLADDAKYTENNKASDFAKGVLAKAQTLDHTRSIADTTACASYTELVAVGGPYVIGTQLRHTADGTKVTLVDTVVATTGNWMFNAKTTLGYVKDENWGELPEAQRSPREVLKKAADDYLNMWSNSTAKAAVPWGSPCTRTEGSMHITPDCRAGAPNGGTMQNSDRRYVIDETVGTCDVLLKFGGNMPDSHEFRLVSGKMVLVHTITV
jgi:hypothetical protein